jgi:hypothetical protein
MNIRFYYDSDGLPHINQHDVLEGEVAEALARKLEDTKSKEGSRTAIGRTKSGRILKVIYLPEPENHGIFVITAYDLPPKQAKALQRRLRR